MRSQQFIVTGGPRCSLTKAFYVSWLDHAAGTTDKVRSQAVLSVERARPRLFRCPIASLETVRVLLPSYYVQYAIVNTV